MMIHCCNMRTVTVGTHKRARSAHDLPIKGAFHCPYGRSSPEGGQIAHQNGHRFSIRGLARATRTLLEHGASGSLRGQAPHGRSRPRTEYETQARRARRSHCTARASQNCTYKQP